MTIRCCVLGLALWCLAPTALAAINRCAAADGTWLYSDQPCRNHNATERLPPIPTERQRPGQDGAATGSAPNMPRPGGVAPSGPLSIYGIGCPAHSANGLATALRTAFESRDANQIANLTDWRGVSTNAAYRLMSRYRYLVTHPPVAVEVDTVATETLQATARLDAGGTWVTDAAPNVPSVQGIRVDYASQAGVDSHLSEYFNFAPRGDCYWLKP